jgi:hypothetical protein
MAQVADSVRLLQIVISNVGPCSLCRSGRLHCWLRILTYNGKIFSRCFCSRSMVSCAVSDILNIT